MKWERLRSGVLRFHGESTMSTILALVHNDDYTWSIPAGWPAPFWIDVYPKTVEAQNLLLGVVDSEISCAECNWYESCESGAPLGKSCWSPKELANGP